MTNINWSDHYFAVCMTSQPDEIVQVYFIVKSLNLINQN